ncbi:MAG: integrin alpha, partial [Planctomycetota bacterium JB042]
DGRDDFAAGALLDTVGGPQAGSVQVFSGGTGALIRRFDGAPSDRLGLAVDLAGDVDLDGVTDLVAGAQQPTLGGYAEVFSGLGGSVLKLSEATKLQGFGFAVAGAGDVDGDGFDDVVVGVPNFDGTFEDQGAARVFLSPGGDLRSTVVGTHPGDRVGTAVEGGFDGDADGLSDVVIGAPFFADPAPESGRAIAWSIRGGGPALATFGQPPGATWYGLDVAGVGDIDQDGTPDLAVGSIWDSTGALNAGSAWIHSGATGQLLHQFSGDSAHDHLSESIAGAGDVDQDGFADVITGAPNDDNTVFNAGSARVHSGRTGAPLHTFDGSGTQHAFGWSVDGAGDVDGDGFDDVLAGAFSGNEARLHSGRTGALLAQWTGSSGSRFGSAVAGVGDVNGDGFPDALVGAPLASEGSSVNGGAYVFSGAGAGLLRSHGGTFPNDWLGASVAGLGDADGDGFSDYAVGASTNATGGVGYARFFSGATGNVLHSVYGDASETTLGAGVGPAGDWDGDGRDDALVGARAGGPLGAGQVEVVSPATGAILETFSGPGSSAAFGAGLDHLGDVDGDGRPEIVVGASGSAHVFGRPCAPAEHYGLGCPGSGGHVPRLVVSGCATAGFDVTLGLHDALGGTNALLLFGAQKAQVPAFGACDLLVAPLLSAGVALPLPGTGPAAGSFVAAGTLPPSASGLTVAAQAFVADPGAPAGGAATNGVLLAP